GFKTGATLYYSPANSDPATDGKRIVVTSYPGKGPDPDIYCFNAKTGDLEWKRRNPGEKSICVFNSPFVLGDRFYIADIGGGLYCMMMAGGKEVWRSSIGQSNYDNWPVVADGKVYVSGLRGNLVCFDAATGKKEWAYSTGDGYLLASPTVWRDLVIIPSTDGWVTAIHAASPGAGLEPPSRQERQRM
ncbi:MAG: PQQ-like beta-propeller repeat protein, partial [Armatimonadetes bacterium]|nr:PQQ-like beta-propeller repeat protein [Armatimonadota bacterium]